MAFLTSAKAKANKKSTLKLIYIVNMRTKEKSENKDVKDLFIVRTAILGSELNSSTTEIFIVPNSNELNILVEIMNFLARFQRSKNLSSFNLW